MTVEVRHRRVGDRIEHLRALLDDARGFELTPDHEAGDVLQEQQRRVDLVAQLDEVRALLRRIGREHAQVGEHPHRIAVDRRPPAHQRGPEAGLELLEARAVHHPGQHGVHVDRCPQVASHQAQELVGIVTRRVRPQRRPRSGLAPVEVRHDLAALADRVHLVDREVVAEARDLGVHAGTAEGLVVALLARRHLHQRRSGEEDLRLVLHQDRVVGQPRLVGAACGRGAEHDAHRRHVELRQFDELVEEAPGLGEVLDLEASPAAVAGLDTQIGAGALDEADVGHAVVAGDLEGAHPLLADIGRRARRRAPRGRWRARRTRYRR